jgi:hypothetical protein
MAVDEVSGNCEDTRTHQRESPGNVPALDLIDAPAPWPAAGVSPCERKQFTGADFESYGVWIGKVLLMVRIQSASPWRY